MQQMRGPMSVFVHCLRGNRISWPVLLILAANAVRDIRKKEILLMPDCLFAVCGLALRLIPAEEDGLFALMTAAGIFPPAGGFSQLTSAIGPGALLLLLSALSGGRIGAGDGILVMAAGVWTGAEEMLRMCAAGMVLASFPSCLLILLRRSGDAEIPLVPFLLAGYILSALIW